MNTPNFILYPTTNPITSAVAAGQRMFSITGNMSTSSELIASLELNTTNTGTQSISGAMHQWHRSIRQLDPVSQRISCLVHAISRRKRQLKCIPFLGERY